MRGQKAHGNQQPTAAWLQHGLNGSGVEQPQHSALQPHVGVGGAEGLPGVGPLGLLAGPSLPHLRQGSRAGSDGGGWRQRRRRRWRRLCLSRLGMSGRSDTHLQVVLGGIGRRGQAPGAQSPGAKSGERSLQRRHAHHLAQQSSEADPERGRPGSRLRAGQVAAQKCDGLRGGPRAHRLIHRAVQALPNVLQPAGPAVRVSTHTPATTCGGQRPRG